MQGRAVQTKGDESFRNVFNKKKLKAVRTAPVIKAKSFDFNRNLDDVHL